MMVEQFNHESFGTEISKNNGFAIGKKWMNVTITMWNEDIKNGHLRRIDLYEDGKFPKDWLDKVLK